MKRIKQIFISVLFIVPALAGSLGYYMETHSILDSLYGTFCLYLVNPVFDEVNPLIEIARWTGPLATASGIALAAENLASRIKCWITSLHNDATIVYAQPDDEYARRLALSCKHGLLSAIVDDELRFYPNAKDHILLLPKDEDNLAFYEDHKEELKDKNVFMKLEKMNSFLLNESNIHYFNLSEIVAFDYWKRENLISSYKAQLADEPEKPFKLQIAIVGFDAIGQKLLDYGILSNLYAESQQIVYHVFGDASVYKSLHANMNLVNDDTIVYHDEEWYRNIDILKKCDRIIITDDTDNALIESILYTCVGSEVNIYSPDGVSYSELYKFPHLKEFGDSEKLYTEDVIKNETRLIAAKKLNHRYACEYGAATDIESEWKKLDGFTKASNFASTNYHYIRKEIIAVREELGIPVDMDELSRIEHIRWCRFHYLNQWEYGILENGKTKDSVKHIHSCLVPYEELSENNKKKDYDAVKLLLDNF